MIQSPPRTILEVFENLPEGTLAQLINNQLYITTSPDFYHQDLVTEIASHLSNHVAENRLGKVIVAPMDVYFNSQNVYQPDVIFISTARLSEIVRDGKIKGAPDLIIEVLSPGTEKFDKNEKKDVYESAGVKEYWMIEPTTKKVIGFRLVNNKFIELPFTTGVISSRLLGTSFQL